MTHTGNLYVIAAPSGTGKTTLVKALVDSIPKLTVSISHTTRAKRPNEMNGINYYFVDKKEFQQMVEAHAFLEHAIIFGNHYGTSKRWVNETLEKGLDVILEIDWQGYRQIKQLFPETIGIFVLPPSLTDLKDRLIKRNQDHLNVVQDRLADAKETISHAPEFEYLIINDDFTHALHELKTIVEAGRLLTHCQIDKFNNLCEKFDLKI